MSGRFRRGREHIEAAASRGGGGGKDRYLKWASGETKFVRFLVEVDDLATVWTHEQVEKFGGGKMSFICRRELDEECELCVIADANDNKGPARRRELTYGIGVWREPNRDESGVITGYHDVTEEVEMDGQTKVVPYVAIIRQGPKNFWRQIEHLADLKGTLLDREYEITRKGGDKDTQYFVVPCDPVPLPEGAKDWATYLHGRFQNYIPDLDAVLGRYASMDFYNYFLRGIDSNNKDGQASPEQVAEATSVNEPSVGESAFDRLKAEKERLAMTATDGTYE